MRLRRLVLSEFAWDSREDLAAALARLPDRDRLIKDESRTVIWQAALPSGAQAIVKTYRSRSWFDFWRESLTRFRVQREFDALGFLARKEIPCACPICWASGDGDEEGRFETLVTFQEPGVGGLKDYLRSGQASDRWIESVAGLVRLGHDAGFYHGALAPRNILIRGAGGRDPWCMFIDTPKSIVFPRPVTGTRMAKHDLMVLLGEISQVAPQTVLAPFLGAYGWPAAEIPAFVGEIRRYRPTRNTRNRMRAEFLVRRLFSQ